MRRVALVGAGVSKFGVRKASYRDLIWEAGKACFDSLPAVRPKDLEGLVVGLPTARLPYPPQHSLGVVRQCVVGRIDQEELLLQADGELAVEPVVHLRPPGTRG